MTTMKTELFQTPVHPSQGLFSVMEDKINALGFDGVLYSFYPKPMYMNQNIQPVLQHSGSFTPFIGRYVEKNYGNRDFVLRMALQGRTDPVDWWQEIEQGNVSPEEQEVTQDARDNFGIQNGLSIPVLYGTFAIAGISVISSESDKAKFQALKAQSLDSLCDIATNYHSEVIKSTKELHFFILPLLESLNDTKRKVLKHLVSGQPMKTIEDIHGVKQRYAEKVLLDIRKEFGGITANELIYILGMINILEYL